MKLHIPFYRPSTREIQALHEHVAYYFYEVDREIAREEQRNKQTGGMKTLAVFREDPVGPLCLVAIGL